jgi:hypothetical protein
VPFRRPPLRPRPNPIASPGPLIWASAWRRPFLALTQMGLANSIITLAFGVPLIGVALAIGLAFGLGGRETAAKQLDQWQVQMKEVDKQLAAQAPETPELPAAPDQPQA